MAKTVKPRLPLIQALSWIVASIFFVTCPLYLIIKRYYFQDKNRESLPQACIEYIIQTGPQKEALKTEYLAELLGLSADYPTPTESFDLKKAKKKLLRSPLISSLKLKVLPPNTLLIDYAIRKPIAWLGDYENVVIDKEGRLFPFAPFFSPKNLPTLYLGLKEEISLGEALPEKNFSIALDLLHILSNQEEFFVDWFDVSKAFSESYGTREIVLRVREIGQSPRLLRLSTKNYAQELGNYMQLRPRLREEDRKKKESAAGERVIDFRLSNLAYF